MSLALQLEVSTALEPALPPWSSFKAQSARCLEKPGILYIAQRNSDYRKAVANAWVEAGGQVQLAKDYWAFVGTSIVGDGLFGSTLFCQVMADRLNMALVTPENRWLPQLSRCWTKRWIRIQKLQDIVWPGFVKPLDHDQFQAGVYRSVEELRLSAWEKLAPMQLVITAEVVQLESEVRAFVDRGKVLDIVTYKGSESACGAYEFLERFLTLEQFGIPCVVDLAHIHGRGWGILEFNPSWASHLYTCRPAQVLPSIRNAVSSQNFFESEKKNP